MTSLKERYGPTALIARRREPLAEITRELTQKFGIDILPHRRRRSDHLQRSSSSSHLCLQDSLLAARKGTQRFAKFTSTISGPLFAQFQALQQHVAFHKDGSEDVFLNERLTVKITPTDPDHYFLNITIQLTPATLYPVTLLTYRYGGLGWRATAEWNRDNSEVLTSEGMDRRHADNTNARWCIVQGALGKDYGGIAVLSHPDNFNHPEPLRVWPNTSNGRGDLFANFSPTKDRNWVLYPGRSYTLRYRWIVFNGHFTKQQAESAWYYFAHPPHITVNK